jgi:hypothetical protein
MGEPQLVPYTNAGRDYLCGRCSHVLPEGAHITHGQADGQLTWVRAANGDGDVVHECGEVPGG